MNYFLFILLFFSNFCSSIKVNYINGFQIISFFIFKSSLKKLYSLEKLPSFFKTKFMRTFYVKDFISLLGSFYIRNKVKTYLKKNTENKETQYDNQRNYSDSNSPESNLKTKNLQNNSPSFDNLFLTDEKQKSINKKPSSRMIFINFPNNIEINEDFKKDFFESLHLKKYPNEAVSYAYGEWREDFYKSVKKEKNNIFVFLQGTNKEEIKETISNKTLLELFNISNKLQFNPDLNYFLIELASEESEENTLTIESVMNLKCLIKEAEIIQIENKRETCFFKISEKSENTGWNFFVKSEMSCVKKLF